MHAILFLMSQSLRTRCTWCSPIWTSMNEDLHRQASQYYIRCRDNVQTTTPGYYLLCWCMSQLGTTGDNPGATEVPGVQADEWPSRGAVCWGGVMFCAVTQITEIYWNSNWHSSPPMVILWRTPRGQKPDFLSQEGFLVWLRWAWYCIHTTCDNDKLSYSFFLVHVNDSNTDVQNILCSG